jgi:hypothetical protein
MLLLLNLTTSSQSTIHYQPTSLLLSFFRPQIAFSAKPPFS